MDFGMGFLFLGWVRQRNRRSEAVGKEGLGAG
jgi:hypothetical protein